MDLDEEHEQATSYDIAFDGDLTLEFNRNVVICDFPILKTTVQKKTAWISKLCPEFLVFVVLFDFSHVLFCVILSACPFFR